MVVMGGCTRCEMQGIPLEEATTWKVAAEDYSPIDFSRDDYNCHICGWSREECFDAAWTLMTELRTRKHFRDPRLRLTEIENLLDSKNLHCSPNLEVEELERLLRWTFHFSAGNDFFAMRNRIAQIPLEEREGP